MKKIIILITLSFFLFNKNYSQTLVISGVPDPVLRGSTFTVTYTLESVSMDNWNLIATCSACTMISYNPSQTISSSGTIVWLVTFTAENDNSINDIIFDGSASNGTVTYGAIEETVPLPITLADFNATQVASTVVLKWITASEQENKGFIIQRSADGIHFEDIGQEKGHGTTTEPQYYEWTDAQPLPGINYYRLKQVDWDGKFEYHKVIAIEFNGKSGDQGIRLYPTEVRDRLTFTLDAPTTQDATLLVTDVAGRIVQTQRLGVGTTQEEIQLGALPQGQYFITLQSGKTLHTARFVKLGR